VKEVLMWLNIGILTKSLRWQLWKQYFMRYVLICTSWCPQIHERKNFQYYLMWKVAHAISRHYLCCLTLLTFKNFSFRRNNMLYLIILSGDLCQILHTVHYAKNKKLRNGKTNYQQKWHFCIFRENDITEFFYILPIVSVSSK
jgi:hypothetical protein